MPASIDDYVLVLEGDAAVAVLENVGGILSIPIVIVEVYVEPSENYLCSSAVTEHRCGRFFCVWNLTG